LRGEAREISLSSKPVFFATRKQKTHKITKITHTDSKGENNIALKMGSQIWYDSYMYTLF
jgi:hypothetical protein